MTDERISAIEALLDAAKEAHGVYEETELNGVYDEQWPAWYARYAVDNGLGDVLGRSLDADGVAAFFTRGWEEFRAIDPEPTESWSSWTARRIATEL
jgi:hypothetical protein